MSKKSTKTDLARIDRMTDDDIDYSDIPPLDDTFLTKPTVQWPPAKPPRPRSKPATRKKSRPDNILEIGTT